MCLLNSYYAYKGVIKKLCVFLMTKNLRKWVKKQFDIKKINKKKKNQIKIFLKIEVENVYYRRMKKEGDNDE